MTRIVVIAGTDSSGGAGLTRDIAVAQSLGCRVLPVVTAVTAQTDSAIIGIQPTPPELVVQQIAAAFASGMPGVVKIGMLGTSEIAECVAEGLAGRSVHVVLDPVLKASSGEDLIMGQMPKQLISQASLITPNLAEAAMLTGRPVAKNSSELAAQATILMSLGARAVLIKGGHGEGASSTDHLFDDSGHREFSAVRLSSGRRGTGCTLATAIACNLAHGSSLSDACGQAKAFVSAWLGDASGNVSAECLGPSRPA